MQQLAIDASDALFQVLKNKTRQVGQVVDLMLPYSRFMAPSSIQSTPPIFVSWNNNWNQSEWDQNPLTIPVIIEAPFHPCIWIYFSLRPGCWSLWRLVQIPWNEVCISSEAILKKPKVKVRRKRRCHEVCSCKSITLFQNLIVHGLIYLYYNIMCCTLHTTTCQTVSQVWEIGIVTATLL